jgi:hypothetical protein
MRQLADHFKDHPAVHVGCRLLDDMLRDGHERYEHGNVFRELDRLYQRGLKGREAFEIVGSVFLYFHHRPDLRDDKRLDFALARGVLLARPRNRMLHTDKYIQYEPLKTSVLAELGQRLRTTYARTFKNLCDYLDEEDAQRRSVSASLATPFTTTSSQGVSP